MYPNAQCVSDQRFIYSPWTPVVGRTERQEKDENSEDLAGDRKLDGRPPKPGGLNLWGSRRDHQLGLLDPKHEGKAGNVGLSLQQQHEEGEWGLQGYVTLTLWAVWVEEVVRGWVSFPSLCYWNRKLVSRSWLIVTHRHTGSSGSSCAGIQVSSSSSNGSVLVPRQHHSLQSWRPALQSRQGRQLPCAGQWVNCFSICTLRAVSTAFSAPSPTLLSLLGRGHSCLLPCTQANRCCTHWERAAFLRAPLVSPDWAMGWGRVRSQAE